MATADRADIIRAIFAAYLSSNRKQVEDVLSDDFRFTSPYDDNIDKPTYFERCWKNSDWIERHELEKIFVDGDEAFVTYLCVAKGHKNGGKSFRLFRRSLRKRCLRQAAGNLIPVARTAVVNSLGKSSACDLRRVPAGSR